MIARRELLGSSVLATMFGGQQMTERQATDIVNALKDLRTAIDKQQSFSEIDAVRKGMIDFLKQQGKFPDFIEVGADLWVAAYDWHVRHLRPITVGRDQAGRYTLALMQTTLILRPDTVPSFIGTPYDNR
jgi:hypothetical protein